MTTSGDTVGLRGNTPAFEYTTFKRPVIRGSGSARTLIDSESNSVILLDRYAGTTFTLPTAVPGMEYTFLSNVTSNTNVIAVGASPSGAKMIGNLIVSIVGNLVSGSTYVAAAGSSIVKVAMNGTTTGGVQGTKIVCTALSAGTWFVSGTVIGTGVTQTPFSA